MSNWHQEFFFFLEIDIVFFFFNLACTILKARKKLIRLTRRFQKAVNGGEKRGD